MREHQTAVDKQGTPLHAGGEGTLMGLGPAELFRQAAPGLQLGCEDSR